jgi:hypothetical protein
MELPFSGTRICGPLCGVIFMAVLGAVILRAACALYNKMAGGAGSPSAVPKPEWGRAILITFVTAIVNFGAGLLLGFGGGEMLNILIAVPAAFLVMAGMLTAMLPTSFPRALLVTLLYYVIMMAIAAVIVVTLELIFGAADRRGMLSMASNRLSSWPSCSSSAPPQSWAGDGPGGQPPFASA